MDRKLFDAAWTGNVEYLRKLIEDDPRLLHAVALAGGETPLHIACLAGHLNFAKEVMKFRREFAGELNGDGFSPLHIAAANGEIEIVNELLKIDRNLCLVKGRERRIALHYAAIKGRVDVVRELVLASVESVGEVTAQGETALHLAVKNNQFEAFRVLVEHLKEFKKEDVLNKKDDHGNTFLHIAVSRKQYEVVDLLFNEHFLTKGTMEVNSLNKRGLTPLDVLLLFQSEAGDREMEEILRRGGAKRHEDLYSSVQVGASNEPSNAQSITTEQSTRYPGRQLIEYFKYNTIKDSPNEVRNTLLVIAILIATATYQAVLSPPGGAWQDDAAASGGNNGGTPPHTAGEAIMGSHNPMAYSLFLLFNSIGFFTSLHMINILTVGFPMRLEMQISILALIVTYDSCMTAISPNSFITLFFTAISITIPLVIPIATMAVRNRVTRRRGALPCTNPSSA